MLKGWGGLEVAPLAGSVDRNLRWNPLQCRDSKSLPSRGAWIEMKVLDTLRDKIGVAPLAGSVDRNQEWDEDF